MSSKHFDNIYVARCPGCGSIVAAAVDDADDPELNNDLRHWKFRGLFVERIANDGIRVPGCYCETRRED